MARHEDYVPHGVIPACLLLMQFVRHLLCQIDAMREAYRY
jgi:hypothetical protein